jgi:hypothetical protein
MITIDQEIFDENLRLTQVYCDFQVNQSRDKNPAKILRSINPVYNGRPSFSFEQRDDYFQTDWITDQLSPQGQSIYTEMFDFQIKRKKELSKDKEKNFLPDGEILITGIDEVITDGISEMESKGFIDINDCTPIDTWFYMVYNQNHRILFSWIPRNFVKLVEEGIAVNALATFEWYDKNSSFLNESKAPPPSGYAETKEYYGPASAVKRMLKFFGF